jgi:glycosyltransferase involved in cell wall biosynthesis
MKLSVIVPVYNEKPTLKTLIEKVVAVRIHKEVILVDDASTDGSQEIIRQLAKKHKLKTFFHRHNQGKGMAIRTGIKAARGDYVIIQDADLEYDPQDYFKLLKPIKDGKAQVVYGSRFTGEHRNSKNPFGHMFFWHWVANQFLTLITNILYNTTLSDMETCYKVFPARLLQSIALNCRRFEFEPEVTAKILRQGVRIYEVPISYAGREYSEGKKIAWHDGLVALWTLIRYRLLP